MEEGAQTPLRRDIRNRRCGLSRGNSHDALLKNRAMDKCAEMHTVKFLACAVLVSTGNYIDRLEM